jgi:MoxR-like ATPase
MPDDVEFGLYRGDGEPRNAGAKLPPQPPSFAERGKYIADPDLAEAINVALWVGQPLLVTGEPGVGKTTVAWSIAHELGLDGPHTFHTRSTSVGRDLLYRYDAVRHFADIQRNEPGAKSTANYIEMEALGKAIKASEKRAVVLIDEIDKAPRDFPNDLLHELDRMQMTIAETGETLSSKLRPVVVITSNEERTLPLPFLRRCVSHHIDFPTKERLQVILRSRLDGTGVGRPLQEAVVERGTEMRDLNGITKRPSTSEMLAWAWALYRRGIDAAALRATPRHELPLLGVLLKSRDDLAVARRAR